MGVRHWLAAGQLPRGDTGPVTAAIDQGTRELPVAYPVSADWAGSANLHIGEDHHGRRPWHVATLDPATGLRPGTVTVSVTVNGVTQHATVTITR